MKTLTRPARLVAGSMLAVAALGITACSETEGDEKGASIEDVQEEDSDFASADNFYDGAYDSDFADDMDSYVGQEVTLSAEVAEVVSDKAFSIAGGDVEALLIVGAESQNDIEPGQLVKVTGTVKKALTVTELEDELQFELDDNLFIDWEGEPYVVATKVDSTVNDDNDA